MRFHRLSALFVAAWVGSACAGGSALVDPDPSQIPSLEATVSADADDLDAALRLAAAYRAADRTAEARVLMARWVETDPDDPGVAVMAGLLDEDAGDYAAARDRYEALLASGIDDPLAEEVERRLDIIRVEALRADARASLERESELAQTTPDPAAVGVFPFVYDGADPQWEPLGLAMAELLSTDLSVTGRLRVVERVRVQALLDEMALGESGFVQEETASRSGRMLGSGHVVQGRFRVGEGNRLGVDAAVVEVGAPGSVSVDPVDLEDAVDRLFELQKELALEVHDEMGISLTPAERARIDERQTESVQALLAFGRGLGAADRGDFQQAEVHFAEAATIDPSFSLAQSRRAAVAAVASVAAQVGQQLSLQATRLATQRAAVQAIRNAPASVRQQILRNLGQRQRAVLAEVLGQDRLGTSILLELVFRRPGGQP